MKAHRLETVLITLLTTLSVYPRLAHGRGYRMDWQTVAAGGGQSSGGNFSLSGTIGQPDAGFSAGGAYVQQSGFWSDAQNAVGPTLHIERSGSDWNLSWPATFQGFRLETTTQITSQSWTDLGIGISSGTNRSVAVPVTESTRFFRLRNDSSR
jgi:hypothetical protein